jgi:hypothetical protein
MRIIDKNTDYYDFYQNVYKDDTFTFDRRDSFLLTKEIMCDYLLLKSAYYSWRNKQWIYSKFKYLLLQIGNTFWLFLIEVTKINNYDRAEDYDIELLSTWKCFDKPRKLCALDIIDFYHYNRYDKEDIYNKIDDFVQWININNYKTERNINQYTIRNGNIETIKHIPLLKACGIANCVDPHDVYLAFEEYFALEKSSAERREPLGTTDIDKIESHGFDKKTSFRGK